MDQQISLDQGDEESVRKFSHGRQRLGKEDEKILGGQANGREGQGRPQREADGRKEGLQHAACGAFAERCGACQQSDDGQGREQGGGGKSLPFHPCREGRHGDEHARTFRKKSGEGGGG